MAIEGFRVLFREQGILSFFHAGKMTTHREKIPHFRCGYFQPCVCAFVWARRAGFQSAHSDFRSNLDDVTSRGKIPCFCCGYCRLMCVCDATRQESCENSAFSLRLFLACVCVCVCVCVYVCVYVCAATRDATVV